MIVWLWEAPGTSRGARGVTGDEAAAKRAAQSPLKAGDADRVRVEQAVFVLESATIEDAYQRTGRGWQGRRAGTSVRWQRFLTGS